MKTKKGICGRELLALVAILIFAAILRTYKLSSLPISLFGDELDIGYQAYSILKTGKDYLGNSFPLYFHSFYEYRMPVLVYLTVPAVYLFGLSEISVRLIPAIFGTLNVLLVWLFFRQLTKNKALSLFSALIISILPWHFTYSRQAFDVTIMTSFILLAFIFLDRFLKGNKKSLILVSIFSALSFYTYPTSIVFFLLFCPLVFFIYRKMIFKISLKHLIAPGIIFLLLIIPLMVSLVNGEANGRFLGINISSDDKLLDEIHLKRVAKPDFYGRIFHNRFVKYPKVFAENYFESFSSSFLFFNGDPNPRHSTVGFGMLPIICLPLLLLGFYESLKNFGRVENKFFILWLMVAPVASALTVDGGAHATRLFLMVVPLVYLISLGLTRFKSKLLSVVFIFLLLAEFSFFLNQYSVHEPLENWEYYDYGFKEVLLTLRDNENEYEAVFIDNIHDPSLINFLFWMKTDPEWFLDNYTGQDFKENIVDGYDGFMVGKYYFGTINSHTSFTDLVDSSKKAYVGFQNTNEIPGDWDWRTSAPDGIEATTSVVIPGVNLPYMYLLRGSE